MLRIVPLFDSPCSMRIQKLPAVMTDTNPPPAEEEKGGIGSQVPAPPDDEEPSVSTAPASNTKDKTAQHMPASTTRSSSSSSSEEEGARAQGVETETTEAEAAVPSPTPILQSPASHGGAYVNPAMKRMLERQDAAKKAAAAKGSKRDGGFGFLFGGGGGASQKGGTAAKKFDGEPPNESTDAAGGKDEDDEEGSGAAYEHGLRPGDHVYRWSHFGYAYPIQIHGIVLDASASSEVKEGREDEEKKDGSEKGDGEDNGDNNGADASSTAAAPVVAAAAAAAPQCQKIVWATIADFGFTRKGEEEEEGDGNDDADGAESHGGDATKRQPQPHSQLCSQEHADGTATAPPSLHYSSSNDTAASEEKDDTTPRTATKDMSSDRAIADEEIDAAPASNGGSEDGAAADDDDTSSQKPPSGRLSRQRPSKAKKKSEESSFLAQHLKKGRRLNVLTLTDPRDIQKWRKVNYGGKGLFGGGDNNGDGDDRGKQNTEDGERRNDEDDVTTNKEAGGNRFTSWLRSNPSSRCTSPTTTTDADGPAAAEGEAPAVQATLSTDFGAHEAKDTVAAEHPKPTSPPTTTSPPEVTEPKTLEEMVTAANAVELQARQSPRRKVSEGATETDASNNQAQTDKPVRKSSSLANIWPFKSKGANDDSDAPEEAAGADMNKPPDPSSTSKSDPAKIVLARVRFLLENEDDVLPAYHVFNSNSECIAVWCKTGRWSSLQSDVFWYTTAIGNAKSTTLMGLSLAATQPWLIPALPVAAVAAIGTPYLVLHQSKKKCEEATKQLTDGFWAQANAEVYVEAIETWSGLA